MFLFSPMNMLPNGWRTEAYLASSLSLPVSKKCLAQDLGVCQCDKNPSRCSACWAVGLRCAGNSHAEPPWSGASQLLGYWAMDPAWGHVAFPTDPKQQVLTVAEENLWFINGEFSCVTFISRSRQLRKVSFWQNYCGYLTLKYKLQDGLWNK